MMMSLSASAPSFLLLPPCRPKIGSISSPHSLLGSIQTPPPALQPFLFPRHRRRRRRRGGREGGGHPAAAALAGIEGPQSVAEAASVLAAIILVHEGGHFLAATLQGIRVSKFAVGFGPVLARFVAGGVEYSLRAFPLGGFVGFPDDDPDSDVPPDDADLLKNRPVLDRILVVSAGVAANVVFAYLIVFAQVLTVGLPVQEPLPGLLVPEVRPGSAAARDGLRPGDVILGINGAPAPSVSELVDVIKTSAGRNVAMTVAREGTKSLELSVVPDENADGTGRIGVQLSPNYTLSKSASKVSGPVAIIAVGAEVARSSSDGLFQFAAVINLNLAVINLLPLPALDGGTLALILVEAARGGRKIPREVEQRIMSSGILVVVMLGLFLIVRDTLNLDFIKEML
ncbi:hypothetical protein OPV22_027757 [Ensete ventricosum]|uniref:PDZ domain-containing protein n=1 Tax=Ensete ventricosum TaxID=4639 RepID=A0AAV8Q0S0_ENSVE|nr:hypothetical protein OPV22_027757 [Ensete ventricosum]